ncbi:hypothetical protein D3C75_1013490 [compost metagenome]
MYELIAVVQAYFNIFSFFLKKRLGWVECSVRTSASCIVDLLDAASLFFIRCNLLDDLFDIHSVSPLV